MRKNRNINLDLLKVLACVGVVLLHTTMGGFKETGSWNLLAYLYYLGTYSIPLFFMVNGYLLLGKREITYLYILQKVKWILITVSSWSFIVWLFKRDFTTNPIKKIVGSLIQRGYFFQFWFFGALILIYLCLPILRQFLNSKRSYLYSLSLLMTIGLIFELSNILLQMPIQTYVIQTFRLWTWFFYYLLGGYIAQFTIEEIESRFKNWMKIVSILLLLISPIILFFIAKTIYHNLFAEYFYDTLFVKVSTLGIFLTILMLTLNENRRESIVSLSNQTMGVFIIHTYIMKVWEKVLGFNFVGAYLFFALFTLSVSFIIVGMLMKIPYFNRIVKL
ncbi:acyltransferase [Streptococcus pneumoniae]|uniref:acyltransferase n=1 Tax=Streptococcus pneumoniae TaxID=1313 RepID=UPI0005E88DDE|nr:acyltransferase family protein [Streptococcus pneumoniae]CEX10906.1 repeating unit O-acetyltransferase WefK [Streptococcus pneumoniae]CIQ34262.1 repeating unit O-acetyltransferase WefK [Streptococcus pneumoniae]CIT65975.1 repeating unit O-acetyltransferase WefK [Streptococcus pneumoniae]CIU60745.1 repeating unit O-acetyltransferase WefK [Streptococcus pneumoniae]CIU75801.1 repeating unit O-acetyltransferase WefK [Streptococcus pneumoniae]